MPESSSKELEDLREMREEGQTEKAVDRVMRRRRRSFWGFLRESWQTLTLMFLSTCAGLYISARYFGIDPLAVLPPVSQNAPPVSVAPPASAPADPTIVPLPAIKRYESPKSVKETKGGQE